MATGELRAIADVEIGDHVLATDPETAAEVMGNLLGGAQPSPNSSPRGSV
jgi:hypothetical protein